ncbi:DsbA family protein [Streptomyces parvulus]|uniref:DsbA family oxidoreductase n=1 Tax=Streptomyces parvulus TaxID=146923 RepID=UPI001C6887B6|nr:DsbA family oxidoreductase [Streptomyces parvulus]
MDIWSDVACPWCYIGKRKFEIAVDSFTARGDGSARRVDVVFHSFELAPHLPLGVARPIREYLRSDKGMGEEEVSAQLQRIEQIADKVGLDINFEVNSVANTVLAHQLVHYAKGYGKQGEAKEALFAAHFTRGRNVSDLEELAAIAEEIGLDRAAAVRSLAAGEHLSAVREDEELARSYGIRGVPFAVVNGEYGVSGAQEPEVMERVLEQVWSEAQAG